ncbi:MAG: glycosyltransferase family 4 protein [Acidobacteriota bacterium]
MTVVLVVPACPHPFGDTAAKWFDVLIRELVRRGHRVDLVCATEESDARIQQSQCALSTVSGAGTLEVSFRRLVLSRHPIGRKLSSLRRPFSEIVQADGIRRAVEERLGRGYDVLHAEQLWSGWLIAGVPRSLLNVHHLEVIDREHDRPRSWRERKALWQMRRATAAILRRVPNVRFFSPRLSDRARAYAASARHWIVPFALDAAHYQPVPLVADPIVGLIGSMHWPPSRSAAERLITRVWPRVRAQVPRARLIVAGWDADRCLEAHAGVPGLELRANIAHPRDFFSRIAVMAYPPGRGSGMKIKVMEAMAYGVPVVTTAEGVEGLAVEPGVHAHVAEEDDRLADRIVELLRDRPAAERLRDAARALIVERYNPRIVVDGMIDIYREVAGQ